MRVRDVRPSGIDSGVAVSGFPDATYLLLSSRLIPDLDGGYTVATLARARQMADAGVDGGRGPQLLTLDPGSPSAHAEHRRVFAERGLVVSSDRLRNLFDEAAGPDGGAADWLVAASHAGEADAAVEYRPVTDAVARPVLSLPVIAGDPDWHLSTAPVVLFDSAGRVAGVLDGFGGLYRAWLDHTVEQLRSRAPARPVVVICESRQVGELLAEWAHPSVRLLHTVHTMHLEPPFTAEAPVNALWNRWLGIADRFDAVLWPTAAQRDDVVARFGGGGVHTVVPQAVEVAASVVSPEERAPGRVVMLNRLAPGKRVDAAIRAFARVQEELPGATLEVFGEGAERAWLQAQIDEAGLSAAVHLRGLTHDAAAELGRAAVFLSTSAYEGQGLSIAEALAHGCPVVSFDVRYGPREALAAGGGLLVPDGDERALADALVEVLTDSDLRARLAAEAWESARRLEPARVMGALAEVVRAALAAPSRRL